MKRFILEILLFALIQGVFAVLAIERYPLGLDHYVAAGTVMKRARLADAPSPRIIFIGGSNLAFGLNSEDIEKTLGYHPVNMGLNGALGAFYMINEVKQELRANDVVVISLEHPLLFGGDLKGLVRFVFLHRPGAVVLLGWLELRYFMDHALQSFGAIVRTTCGALGHPPMRVPALSRSGFNRYGDFTAHRTIKPLPLYAPTPLTIDPGYNRELIRRLNNLDDYCRQRNVRVFFTYSPMAQSHYEPNRGEIESMHQHLTRSLTIPFLDEPSEMMFPDDKFLDMPFHLRYRWVDLRTRHLTERLAAQLGPGLPAE